jgi:hypothetical protein
MNEEFRKTHREHRSQCEWLAWLGEPMLYDGALFVERDYLTPEQHQKVRQAHLRND